MAYLYQYIPRTNEQEDTRDRMLRLDSEWVRLSREEDNWTQAKEDHMEELMQEIERLADKLLAETYTH